MARRRCKGKTKRGKRCRAAPLRGKSYCSTHDPVRPGSTRFGSPEQARAAGVKGGRPRDPRPVEALRAKIEAEIETWIAPYVDAVKSAVLYATHEGEVRVSDVPDLGARIKAAETAFDRAYGKPRQVTEVSGPEGAPVEVDLKDPETARLAHELLKRLPARDADR